MIDVLKIMVQESKKVLAAGDYVKDGLYHCGKCHTPKQCTVVLFDTEVKPFCMCKCEIERIEAEKQNIAEIKRQERIKQMRRDGIPKDMRDWTFESDRGLCPELLQKANRYVSAWDKMRSENMGVMFWGSTGNGKTYAATCIANRLIDNEISAMVTSIPKLLNDLNGFHIEDKNQYIDELNRYSLLVIDDLGSERGTEYALQKAYEVIDGRYRSSKPLIVTTNLSLEELKKPKSIEYERIYSRVLEMCVPIKCTAPSIRPEFAKEKFAAVKFFLEEKNAE